MLAASGCRLVETACDLFLDRGLELVADERAAAAEDDAPEGVLPVPEFPDLRPNVSQLINRMSVCPHVLTSLSWVPGGYASAPSPHAEADGGYGGQQVPQTSANVFNGLHGNFRNLRRTFASMISMAYE